MYCDYGEHYMNLQVCERKCEVYVSVYKHKSEREEAATINQAQCKPRGRETRAGIIKSV